MTAWDRTRMAGGSSGGAARASLLARRRRAQLEADDGVWALGDVGLEGDLTCDWRDGDV